MSREVEFFAPMMPPSSTAQEQKTGVRDGKPYRYDPPGLARARDALEAAVAPHAPEHPLEGPVVLEVGWHYKADGRRHRAGDLKDTRPDADNLEKALKDAMTNAGYWHDDAQVAVELVEKRWMDVPGIHVRAMEA